MQPQDTFLNPAIISNPQLSNSECYAAFIKHLKPVLKVADSLRQQNQAPLEPHLNEVSSLILACAKGGMQVTYGDLLKSDLAFDDASDMEHARKCDAIADNPSLETLAERSQDQNIIALQHLIRLISMAPSQLHNEHFAPKGAYTALKNGQVSSSALEQLDIWTKICMRRAHIPIPGSKDTEIDFHEDIYDVDNDIQRLKKSSKNVQPHKREQLEYYRHIAYLIINKIDQDPYREFKTGIIIPGLIYNERAGGGPNPHIVSMANATIQSAPILSRGPARSNERTHTAPLELF